MSLDKIISFNQVNDLDKEKVLHEIKYIFYISSSVQNFSSDDHRNLFFEKWCGDYLNNYSEEFFLYINQENKLMGYLSGCKNSTEALGKMRVPGFNIFSDLFTQFPAHLHINFHPEARGIGLGSRLVNHYIEYLSNEKISGLHLVTSPDAKNVSFYERLGFNTKIVRDSNGHPLLFMGKYLPATL